MDKTYHPRLLELGGEQYLLQWWRRVAFNDSEVILFYWRAGASEPSHTHGRICGAVCCPAALLHARGIRGEGIYVGGAFKFLTNTIGLFRHLG